MSTAVDVVCIGLATADTIVVLPSWPEADGRLVADRIVRAGGGPAATAAVTVARLGGSVAFIGALGDDDSGRAARSELAAAGVDVADVKTVPGRTGESVILVDRSAGTRSILHAPGVALPSLEDGALGRCRAARWVHVDHAGHQLVAGIDAAHLSIDAGNPIDGLDIDGVGLYAPTLGALQRRYPGRRPLAAIRLALTEGARQVAVTLGAEGAIAVEASGDAWRVPAPEVEVGSTLGAGDVFHGALMASLAAGHSLAEALGRANLAAALSCRAIDARSSIPTLHELESALAFSPPVEPIMLEQAQ